MAPSHPPEMITTLLYKSRALFHPGQGEMDDLLAHARKRNHELRVTGMLLYENDHFFQCLGLSEMVRRGKHDPATAQPTRRAVSDKPRWREPQGTAVEQRVSMRI